MSLQTSVFLWGDRHFPAGAVGDGAKALEASGVVDYISQSTQLGSFVPRQLWTEENAPMAGLMGDPDSLQDAWLMTGYAHANAPSLGLSVLTDSIRIGPAQLTQMAWTLAHLTEGRSIVHVGAGEMKNARPFGWKRSEGLSRLEDLGRITRAFWEGDGPIDFDGNHWTLDQAFLGGAKPFRPRFHAMGSGPKLLDHATSHFDGLSTAVPCAWFTPEQAAENVDAARAMVADKDRDPDEFGFGMFCPVLIHEDENVIDRALDNPIVRWIAATFGRIQHDDWARSGLEPPTPPGWTYYMKFCPQASDPAFVEDVLSKTTRAHAETGYIYGTPESVAAQLKEYVDAGIGFVAPADYLPVVGDPADAQGATARSIACMSALKAAV